MARRIGLAEKVGAISPPPVAVRFDDYCQAVKNIKLDVWQFDLCRRLETAFWCSRASRFPFVTINIGAGPGYVLAPSGLKIDLEEFEGKKGKGTHAAIHAFPQVGKSIIISQAYPAWILGYDPIHRFRLATFNETRSKRFSAVIRRTMLSSEHRSFFPDPAGFVPLRAPAKEWSTAARDAINDGQSSFSALGLQSGFTGTGFDTLLCDDPYKDAKEALSETIRETVWQFYAATAHPRCDDDSNEFIMFHRYHQDDMGGRALATGIFDLWWYPAEAGPGVDGGGEYIDDETGQRWQPLPVGRVGYLTTRKSDAYFLEQKRNKPIWLSMFQGQPASDAGNMFNVSLIPEIPRSQVSRIVHWVRPWDNAATQDAGAYTAGPLMGIDAGENVYVFDMKREQVGTAERQALQRSTAEMDGKLVQIHIPIDPGSAGIDVAFQFEQEFTRDGYVVAAEPVTGSKEARAYNFSKAVNSGKVFFVDTGWDIKACKNELKYFPGSTYKDQVDALSDGYNHLIKLIRRGLVIKTFSRMNLLPWDLFVHKFGPKIPGHWEVHCAIRLAADPSRPSGWAIVARAAENAHIGEAIFVVAAGRLLASGPALPVAAVKRALEQFCERGAEQASIVWVQSDGADVIEVAAAKLDMQLTRFLDDLSAGVPETNWCFEANEEQSPFFDNPDGKPRLGSSHAHVLVDRKQLDNPVDERGMLSMRQDLETWAFNERGEPQPHSGVTANCVRMILFNFAMTATALTPYERKQTQLPEHLRDKALKEKLGKPEFVDAYAARQHALKKLGEQELRDKSKVSEGQSLGPRPTQRRYRKGS